MSLSSLARPEATPSPRSVPRIMGLVLLALLPAVAARIALLGADAAWQLILAIAVALGFEASMLKLRRQPLRPFAGDLSVPVSAVLLALLLAPQAPWWLLVAGLFVSVALAKHAYGGLGENPFNPAMAGYAVLLIGFPGHFMATQANDPWTSGSLWIACLYALGGLLLIRKKIMPWQAPAGFLAGAAMAVASCQLAGSTESVFDLQAWPIATWMLAAFFIVTDPVTGCMSPRGRLFFGLGAGLLTVWLTRVGGTPDGLPFAVLSMNFAAPWLDRHTRPVRQRQGAQP